jgi:hypothetical protein
MNLAHAYADFGELEALDLEDDFADPFEDDLEDDFEGDEDEFWSNLLRWGAKAVRAVRKSPRLRRVARGALSLGGSTAGKALAGLAGRKYRPYGDVVGGAAGKAIGHWLFPEELEFDELDGFGDELDESAGDLVQQMEHLGYLASTVEDDEEADQFIAALVPLASRLLPRAAGAVARVVPAIARNASRVGRVLRRTPATRPLVRAIPTMVRRATAQVARRALQGQPVSPRAARRAVTRQAARIVRSPRRTAAALGGNRIHVARIAAQNRMLRRRMLQARRLLTA